MRTTYYLYPSSVVQAGRGGSTDLLAKVASVVCMFASSSVTMSEYSECVSRVGLEWVSVLAMRACGRADVVRCRSIIGSLGDDGLSWPT